MNTYFVGTLVEIDASFKDQATGAPADPTNVTAEVRLPDGGTVVILTNSVVRTGVGEYKVPYVTEMSGLHIYRFAGTGAVVASGEGSFLAQTDFP